MVFILMVVVWGDGVVGCIAVVVIRRIVVNVDFLVLIEMILMVLGVVVSEVTVGAVTFFIVVVLIGRIFL